MLGNAESKKFAHIINQHMQQGTGIQTNYAHGTIQLSFKLPNSELILLYDMVGKY